VPRPREFDEQEVLDRALGAFWRRGYTATSVRDLSEATGVAPSALYRTWGDKHELFLAAMDRYADGESRAALAAIGAPGAAVDVLRAWLLGTARELCSDADAKGCLMVNTAGELGLGDPAAAERARRAFEGLRGALEGAVRRGRDAGELAPAVDPRAASELLLTTVVGLRVRGRAGAEPRALEQAVDAVLGVLAPAAREAPVSPRRSSA